MKNIFIYFTTFTHNDIQNVTLLIKINTIFIKSIEFEHNFYFDIIEVIKYIRNFKPI